MAKKNLRHGVLMMILGAVLTVASSAEAQGCETLPQLPIEITDPGVYCLDRNHEVSIASGGVIRILVDNVTLDLQGYTVSNLYGPHTTSSGVYGIDRTNLEVRNGSISGFAHGIVFERGNTSGTCAGGPYEIRDVRVIEAYDIAIFVQGCHVILEGNGVFSAGSMKAGRGMGIYVSGILVSVIDNDVQKILGPNSERTGILVANGYAGVIEDNRVQATATGIHVINAPAVVVRGNIVTEARAGREYVGGLDGGDNY